MCLVESWTAPLELDQLICDLLAKDPDDRPGRMPLSSFLID